MKLSLMITFGLCILNQNLFAHITEYEKTVVLNVDVGTAKKIVYDTDFGPYKVIAVDVPDLAKHTFLKFNDSKNNVSYVASHMVETPEDIIQNRPTTEQIEFKIVVQRNDTILGRGDGGTRCVVYLSETVSATIRGFELYGSQNQRLPDRESSDCE